MSIDNKMPKGLIFSSFTLCVIILNKTETFCLIVIRACNQTAPSFLAILAYSSQFLHSSSSFLFWHCHAVLGSAVFEFDFFAMICHKHSASCHFPCNGTKSFEKGHSLFKVHIFWEGHNNLTIKPSTYFLLTLLTYYKMLRLPYAGHYNPMFAYFLSHFRKLKMLF